MGRGIISTLFKMIDYGELYKAKKTSLPVGVFTKESYLERMRHFWGMYSAGECGLSRGGEFNRSSNRRRSIKEIRDYARGMQDISKYQQLSGAVERKEGKNKGKLLWNISWQPIPILSKFRAILIDKVDSIFLSLSTSAINQEATTEKLKIKNRMKIRRQDEFNQMVQDTPYNPEKENGIDRTLETEDDVDFYYEVGGIQLPAEIMMKDGTDLSLYQSRYGALKEMIIQDVIDLNTFAVEVATINGKEIIKYIDPARLIIRSSIYQDYRDTDFRGYSEDMKLHDLRKLVDVPEDIVKKIEGLNNYTITNNAYKENGSRTDYGDDRYGGYGLEVLTMYFVDVDVHRYVTGWHRFGSRVFERVDNDFQLSKRAAKNRSIEEFKIQKLYKCRWVVGTDFIFDYGEVDYMVRGRNEGGRDVMFPIIVHTIHEPSLMERCIAHSDEIQLANYKIRNIIAKLPPGPRMIINKSKLRDSVKIGSDNFSIIEMIERYQSGGIMVIDEEDDYAHPLESSGSGKSVNPITFVESGIAEDIITMTNQIAQSIDKIRQVTGVNEVADGTSRQQDMLKSVAEGLTQATNSAIKPNINIYTRGYEEMLWYIALKWQRRVVEGDVEAGELPIAPGVAKAVKLSKDLLRYDWNISVRVDSGEDRQVLTERLLMNRERFLSENFFEIYNAIKDGDVKKAQLLISRYEKQAKEEEHRRQIEVQQAVAKGSSDAAIIAEQAKLKTLMAKYQEEASLAKVKHGLDEVAATKDFDRQIKLENLKTQNDTMKEVQVVRENNQNRLQT